jgi:hypothetical protein
MLTETEAREFAEHWISAWNSHDLDAILSHYGPDVKLTSPVAAKLLNDHSGTVAGIEALRTYFKQGLEKYPKLLFELQDVMWGISSVVLCYRNQVRTKTAEFMALDAARKVILVVANYGS